MLVRILVIALAGLILGGCATTSDGVYHTVTPGQTLYRIAHDYGVDELYLARINNIHDPTELPIGKRLYIPGAKTKRKIPSTFPPRVVKPSATTVQKPEPIPRKSNKNQRTAQKSRTSPGSSAPEFDWPIRGQVLKSFRRTGPDGCKGLEIAASPGSPVVSAAAGRVTYSGDEIRGFGNLVILKHSGAYFTVYGYNMKNLVQTGIYVKKGEKIALSGSPPGSVSPRLHFEIRRGKEAVDPIFYLP